MAGRLAQTAGTTGSTLYRWLVRFEVLGSVRIGDVEASGRLRQVLVTMLVAAGNRPVPAAALAEAMWGGPADARTLPKLQFHVHLLRKALDDPARLSFEAGAYRLRVDDGEVDAARFEALVRAAEEASDPDRVVALLRDGLGLWRGEPFHGLDVPVLVDEARRLAELRLTAYDRLYQAELERGRHAVVAAEVADLARAHPLHEEFYRLLMIALHRGGRRVEALAVYRTAWRTLADELGIEPGEELRAVERQVLAGEPVPAQLPDDVDLAGRTTELSELDGLVADRPVVVVAGTAGVGKTALVVHWAHRALRLFPDGQLYVDLRGYGVEAPVSPLDALAGFLRTLGVEGAAIPQDLAERAARFRSLVANRRMLLVLDNARSAEQVRQLLPGSPTVFVVVTSRDALGGLVATAGAHRVNLGRLAAPDAVALLAGATRSADSLEALAELCARLPLALRIAAELIGSRGAADLVTQLAAAPDRLDLLSVDEDPHAAVRGVFSWSYRQLPEPAARLFRLVGAHPGQGVDVHTLAAMSGAGLRDTRRWLDVLVRAHLVDPTTPGRYQPHDLLAVYAAELAETTDTPEERAAAFTRLCDYYLHAARAAIVLATPLARVPDPPATGPAPELPAFPDVDRALAWLRTEHTNLVAAAQRAARGDDSGFPMAIANTLRRYLEMSGRHDASLTLHSLALTIAERRHDLVEVGHALRGLATINGRIGRFDEAARQGERALDAYRVAGDRWGESRALNTVGVAHGQAARYAESNQYLEQAATLYRDAGELPQLSAALNNIGTNHTRLGDYREALRYQLRSLAIAEETGDTYGICHVASNVAEVYELTGQLDLALDAAGRAVEVARDTGNDLIVGEATSILGGVYRRLGDYRRAFGHLDDALTILTAIEDNSMIVDTLTRIAATHLAAGDRDEAERHYRRATEVAGGPFHVATARAGLGDLYAHAGRFGEAREQWGLALELYDKLRLPQAAGLRHRLDVT